MNTEAPRRILTDTVTLEARVALAARDKSQAFFEALHGTIATPHVGEGYRDAIRTVLKRALDAGLYDP